MNFLKRYKRYCKFIFQDLARFRNFHQAFGELVEGDRLFCGDVDLPYDDHLSEVYLPPLYEGAQGGAGDLGDYTVSLLGSHDKTRINVQLLPDSERGRDFDHNGFCFRLSRWKRRGKTWSLGFYKPLKAAFSGASTLSKVDGPRTRPLRMRMRFCKSCLLGKGCMTFARRGRRRTHVCHFCRPVRPAGRGARSRHTVSCGAPTFDKPRFKRLPSSADLALLTSSPSGDAPPSAVDAPINQENSARTSPS